MKSSRLNRFLASSAIACSLVGTSLGLEYQWDVNDSAVGLGGTGAWNTSDAFWDPVGTAPDDGTATTTAYTFTDADKAIFAGTAGTVTLGTGVTLNSIQIDTAGYVITGNTLTLAGTTPTITANANASVSSALAGSAGLFKAGTGNLTLSGNNTFTGNATVGAGTLTLSRGAGFGNNSGSISTGALTINSGAIATTTIAFAISGDISATNSRVVNVNGTLNLAASEYIKTYNLTGGTINAPTASGDFLRTSSAGLFINSLASADTSTINNKIDLTFGSATIDTANGAAASDLTITGVISENSGAGTGAKTITKSGAGTLTLSGLANTYTGGTIVNGGELRSEMGTNAPGTYTPFGNGGAVTINTGASLRLKAGSTSNAYTFANAVNLNAATLIYDDGNHILSGNVALTGSNSINGVWSGKTLTMSGIVSGSGSITHGGTSTLTLSGVNTYTGGTTVTGGGLSINSGSSLGSGALSFTTVGTSLTITGTAVTLANNIALPTTGTGNVTFTTPTSSATILNGTLSGGAAGTVLFFRGGGAGTSTGSLTLNGINSELLGTIDVQRGPLILGNANAAGSTKIILNSNSPAAGALQIGNFTIANSLSLSSGASVGVATGLSGGISGTIANTSGLSPTFTKLGGGTLTISGSNTYTGSTNVSSGTLVIANANASSGFSVSSGATLALRNINLGSTQNITGAGNVTKDISTYGQSTINGNNNTYTGSTIVNIDRFTLGSTGVINGTSGISVLGQWGANFNNLGSITTPGAVTVAGTGNLTSGSVTTDSSIFRNSGTINAASMTLSSSSSANTSANRGGTYSQTAGSTTLTGALTLALNGGTGAAGTAGNDATFNLTGGSFSADTIAVNAGNLNASGGSLSANSLTVGSGAVLTVSGTAVIDSPVTTLAGSKLTGNGGLFEQNVTIHGTHAPGSSPGLQTFAGDLTYADGSIFSWDLAGTLKDSNSSGVRGTDWDAVNVGGTLSGLDGPDANSTADAVFRIVLDGTQTFADSFWNQDRVWNDIFMTSSGGTPIDFSSIFGGGFEFYNSSGNIGNTNSTGRGFTISGSSLSWSAVPEPSSAMAGLLIAAGLLRRRRAK